jgi:translation initiation factor 2 subunit 2
MSAKSYEEMLDRARAKLPKETSKKDRFEPPKPESTVTGNRTILHNFRELCTYLERDPKHLLKFLSGELATASSVEESRAVFQGKFTNQAIGGLVNRYIQEFVLCPVCHQPDTDIVRKDRFNFLVCKACGARSSIRTV